MATITLKGVPEALHKKIKERARRNRRSLNSEILYCIEKQPPASVAGAPAGDGSAMAAALNDLAAQGGIASMDDPCLWQQQQRRERRLPER